MTKINIDGTIYGELSDNIERHRYQIGYDGRQIGGEELNSREFIDNYVREKVGGRGLTHLYVCMLIDDEYDMWVSRLICFGSELHKMVWIANNNSKSLGTLNQYVGVFCN